jgi:hypothetical protein
MLTWRWVKCLPSQLKGPSQIVHRKPRSSSAYICAHRLRRSLPAFPVKKCRGNQALAGSEPHDSPSPRSRREGEGLFKILQPPAVAERTLLTRKPSTGAAYSVFSPQAGRGDRACDQFLHSLERRDLSSGWASSFAGVTRFLRFVRIGPLTPGESYDCI